MTIYTLLSKMKNANLRLVVPHRTKEIRVVSNTAALLLYTGKQTRFRPHRMQNVTCIMPPTATDDQSVCLFVTRLRSAKTAKRSVVLSKVQIQGTQGTLY